MSQESFYFFLSHVLWVAFVVEQNKAPRPVNISLLGSDAVMHGAYRRTYLIEQLRLIRGHDVFLRIFGGFMFASLDFIGLDIPQAGFIRRVKIFENVNMTSTLRYALCH